MIWQPILFSSIIAIMFTLVLVMVLGWRRPNAGVDEGHAPSGAFVFLLLFLALWASSAWIRPWGPIVWDVPVASLFVFALVMTLILATGTGMALRSAASSQILDQPPSGSAASSIVAEREATRGVVESFGMLFWVLVSVLLIVALFGSA